MFLFEGNYSVAFVPLADRPCPIFLFPSLLFCPLFFSFSHFAPVFYARWWITARRAKPREKFDNAQ